MSCACCNTLLPSSWSVAFMRLDPLHDSYLQPFDFRGEDEVAAREAVDLVRPDLDAHVSPRQIDVGMVPFLFRDRADAVRERERAGEVRERKLFLEMMLIHDPPAAAQLAFERPQLVPFQRRHASAAG